MRKFEIHLLSIFIPHGKSYVDDIGPLPFESSPPVNDISFSHAIKPRSSFVPVKMSFFFAFRTNLRFNRNIWRKISWLYLEWDYQVNIRGNRQQELWYSITPTRCYPTQEYQYWLNPDSFASIGIEPMGKIERLQVCTNYATISSSHIVMPITLKCRKITRLKHFGKCSIFMYPERSYQMQ